MHPAKFWETCKVQQEHMQVAGHVHSMYLATLFIVAGKLSQVLQLGSEHRHLGWVPAWVAQTLSPIWV